MKKFKSLTILVIMLTVLISQTSVALAAPTLQEGFTTGTVTDVTCETDTDTGVSTFFVTVEVQEGVFQTVHIDQTTAETLGIVTSETVCNSDGTVAGAVLGLEVSIDPATVIPESEEPKHPVGLVLSLFFADITDYDTIMATHEDGTGFGVIAQALWMTKNNLENGTGDDFLAIINAKKTGDYSYFEGYFEDGVPQNWGQFKKALLNGMKNGNLGQVMSANGKNNEKSYNGKGPKTEKTNNGNANGKDK